MFALGTFIYNFDFFVPLLMPGDYTFSSVPDIRVIPRFKRVARRVCTPPNLIALSKCQNLFRIMATQAVSPFWTFLHQDRRIHRCQFASNPATSSAHWVGNAVEETNHSLRNFGLGTLLICFCYIYQHGFVCL